MVKLDLWRHCPFFCFHFFRSYLIQGGMVSREYMNALFIVSTIACLHSAVLHATKTPKEPPFQELSFLYPCAILKTPLI